MQQVKRKLNASCQMGFQDPAWESPLAWPPGWAECTEQRIVLTACQTPVSSWLKLWAPKVQGKQRIQWGWGWVLVDSWPVCQVGMFPSRTLGIVATGLASSSQWMAISPLTECRWAAGICLWPALWELPHLPEHRPRTSGNNLLTRFKPKELIRKEHLGSVWYHSEHVL